MWKQQLILYCLVAVSISMPRACRAVDPSPAQIDFFEREIRPLLVKHCFECHGPQSEAEGGLLLTSREALLRGGDSGPAVQVDGAGKNLLIRAVRYTDPLLQMPPDKKLSSREIAALEKWVDWGLPDPRSERGSVIASAELSPTAVDGWWSFQPVTSSQVPVADDRDWAQSVVDAFVDAKLNEMEIPPAPPADRRTLVRRVTFDLTGLPPTPGEVATFLSDPSPAAVSRLVDRLLTSPQYGERWGRHWLDVVRYADTAGCNGDFPLPQAFRYRNYVVSSWNKDKPFDQFVREQIAGDLLASSAGVSAAEREEQIVATGYLAISRRFSSLGEEFHLTLDDTVDNLGKAVLGLTVSCARCHSHKFDPIPQSDYYALYGVFASTKYSFPGTEIYRHTRHLIPLPDENLVSSDIGPRLTEMDNLDEDIFATYSEMAALDTGEEKDALREVWKKMKERRDKLLKALPEFDMAYGASEGPPVNVRLHIKGDPEKLGEKVPRGFLQVLGGQRLADSASGSGRLELAQWLTDQQNPLTARVIVNRIWSHHFGKGIVRTPNDFGTRGAPPTHPELLDFLSQELMRGGWSIKELQRRIVLSQTYQMAAIEDARLAKLDPDNQYLWTFARRRLDAESIRDSMLAVSGVLDYSTGGPHPFKPEWDWRYSQHVPFIGDFPTRRRSVYLMQQRIRQQPYLAVFDGADTNMSTGTRQVSTTPQQALFMLNSEFMHAQGKYLAERAVRHASNLQDQIEFAFLLALGRPPQLDEFADAQSFITQAKNSLASLPATQRSQAALSGYMRTLLSSNEFMFVE